ncbi:DMT family transporter [Burkholderia arboris]|uniref:DMT family transporter n=1 Tax=Burkholderia arboris TaxID=488730 RepID=UPI00158CE42A|nr:DMT family transporter [Burkholderia arboris]MCA8044990.1 DMT family transporter [Burkholderia arboris]
MRPPASALASNLRPGMRVAALTSVAMLAFASNSLLCRLALQAERIDAASFGSVRLVSGALMLALVARAGARRPAQPADWPAAAMLFAYVVCFSFAYLTVSAATGALILFGAVQLTMFAAGWRGGERFAPLGWAGFGAALAGLLYLVSPGLAAPTPSGAALMTVAGIAWGIYSIRGRRTTDPVAATAGNFMRAAPLALALSVVLAARIHLTPAGIVLAVLSGALTSGIGYVIWYAALRYLTAMRAAAVQLSVPPIAACGAVLFLSEQPTWRLALSSAAILGGVAAVLASRARRAGVAPP